MRDELANNTGIVVQIGKTLEAVKELEKRIGITLVDAAPGTARL
jgi:hypothetical protein